jgi:hypothetical protein
VAHSNTPLFAHSLVKLSSIVTTCGICEKPASLQECCVSQDGKAVHKHCHDETLVATRSDHSDIKKA